MQRRACSLTALIEGRARHWLSARLFAPSQLIARSSESNRVLLRERVYLSYGCDIEQGRAQLLELPRSFLLNLDSGPQRAWLCSVVLGVDDFAWFPTRGAGKGQAAAKSRTVLLAARSVFAERVGGSPKLDASDHMPRASPDPGLGFQKNGPSDPRTASKRNEDCGSLDWAQARKPRETETGGNRGP